MNTLPDCCDFVVPMRTLPAGGPRALPASWPFRAEEGVDYFAYPLTPASFLTGPSDYDIASDQAYCPCGATLDWPDRVLGTAVEIAQAHIDKAHPEATAKARARRRKLEAKR